MENFVAYSTPYDAPPTSFRNAAGEKVALADFKGKVVLLNFWATWCVPCVDEMPSLQKLVQAFDEEYDDEGHDFIVVPVSLDLKDSVIQDFFRAYEITEFDIYRDENQALYQAFEVKGLPTSFLINKKGQVVGDLVKRARWHDEDGVALIEYYLKQ